MEALHDLCNDDGSAWKVSCEEREAASERDSETWIAVSCDVGQQQIQQLEQRHRDRGAIRGLENRRQMAGNLAANVD